MAHFDFQFKFALVNSPRTRFVRLAGFVIEQKQIFLFCSTDCEVLQILRYLDANSYSS